MNKNCIRLVTVAIGLGLSALLIGCDGGDANDDGATSEPTATESAETTTVTLYYGNEEQDAGRPDCSVVFPVERELTATAPVEEAALEALFAGPTDAEADEGFVSQFSAETSSILISLSVEDDTAYVNLTDFRSIIPGASSSCGSATFFAEVETTLKKLVPVDRVIYAIDGDPATFYEFMQVGCNETNDNCDPTPFE